MLVCCVTAALADSVAIRGTSIDNKDTMRVTVAYQLTSREGGAQLLLRALPVSLNASLSISPQAVNIGRSDDEMLAEFVVARKGDAPLQITRVAIGFVEAGEPTVTPRPGQRLFYSRSFEVDWRFPLVQTAGPAPPAGSGGPPRPTALGAPDLTADPVDGKVDLRRLAIYRRLVAALTAKGVMELKDAIQDRRVQRWLMLHMAVSQDEAAEAQLPIGENMPDYQPPANDDPGVYECADTVPEPAPDPRVSDLHVVNIASPRRGCYQVNFTYHIRDITDRVPVTFDCLFDDPDVGAQITQTPWVHVYPTMSFDGGGVVSLLIDTPQAPLAMHDPSFYLRVRGPADQNYARTHIRLNFSLYKSYDMITSTNITDHFADPAYNALTSVGVNEGSNSLDAHMDRFAEEPAMLCFRTASGTLCRGMFKPHRGGQGLEGVWIVDLDCFDTHGAAWVEGHVPADANDWLLPGGMRSYDVAGLMTAGQGFDLDWGGFNCDQSTSDIIVNVDDAGKYLLRTRNGCEMRY